MPTGGDFQAPFFDSSVTATAENMKTSGGYIHTLECHNSNTADAYLQLFDALAANVTLGATTPVQSYLIPGGNGSNVGALEKLFDAPLRFLTAMSYAVTTTATGSTAPTAAIVLNAGYR